MFRSCTPKNLSGIIAGQTLNLENGLDEHEGRKSQYTDRCTTWIRIWSTTKTLLRAAEDVELTLY